ncbi:MAG: LptF/LptG family permease [Cognatishimia sp.]|uniref:LptF/LptG family permease n=1 Tax=Cognatishimia sp. TaxID=2211648 RepID=UPI003B8AE513
MSTNALISRRVSGPILRRYRAMFAYEVFRLTFFVLLGAQAIFLTNVVVADLLPEIIEHQAGLGNFIALTVLTVPGVLVIALPLAVLLGSYLVIMNRRAFGEFASFAGMGFSCKGLLQLNFAIGFGAILVSHLISGYAEPLARYQLAKTLFDIKNDAVREGRIAAGEFNTIGDYVVFADSGRFNKTARGLFIHERLDDGTIRFVTAHHSLRAPVEEQLGLGLILGDVAVYQFSFDEGLSQSTEPCAGCVAETAEITLSEKMFIQFREPEAAELPARRSRVLDQTNLELLRSGTNDADAAATVAERFLRDLLCLVAPFVALLAAALTTPRTYLYALPLAGALVLSSQFLGTFLVQSLTGAGMFTMLTGIAAVATAIGIALIAVIIRRESGLIQPLDTRL